MIFKFRAEGKTPLHIKLTVFAGEGEALGNCGSLVMRIDEYLAFKDFVQTYPQPSENGHEIHFSGPQP